MALLKSGRISEAEGDEYKIIHTAITKSLTDAKKDSTFTKEEINSIIKELNDINDTLTAVAGGAEGDKELPSLFKIHDHKLAKTLKKGIESGRLSSTEASKIKRQLDKLTSLEEELKVLLKIDKDISQIEKKKLYKERGKFFKEIAKVTREIKKEIRRELRD